MLEAIGMDLKEIIGLRDAALDSVSSTMLEVSRGYLREASPEACNGIRNALLAPWISAFSEAGRGLMILLLTAEQPRALATWDDLLTTLLANPVNFCDIAVWCLFFAALEAAAKFQLDHCPSPSNETFLTGLLLGRLEAECEQWCQTASVPLARSGSSLSLQSIDLSVLGGEQATGGDFGLILDFDDRNVQRTLKGRGLGRRIVPLIFQAKRFVRPNADVSQRHALRGYQSHFLAQNDCASAYIFYENGRKRVDRPVPPLVKPIRKVAAPSRTLVFSDSYDISSYLLNALTDERFAAGASAADEALRMIYAKADPGQLAHLAVISNDARAVDRYAARLADLAPVLRAQPRDGDSV
jgi:hypothetical protein